MALTRAILALCWSLVVTSAQSAEPFITVASTTSTEQSGLFKHLLPGYTAKTGVQVRVVALGTGQALDMGRRGDADVVFVHDASAEDAFVKQGYGVQRHEVMYNDFVLIGPAGDRALVAGGSDIVEALRKIAAAQAPFVSRGDKSGTHAAELRFWKLAAVDVSGARGWYREIGGGMGQALNAAAGTNAHLLSDRGTWLSFKNRGELKILVEGDRRLFNQYGVILVSPARHPHVKKLLGQQFIDWLLSSEGQSAIATFKIGGQQLFFPNAKRPLSGCAARAGYAIFH